MTPVPVPVPWLLKPVSQVHVTTFPTWLQVEFCGHPPLLCEQISKIVRIIDSIDLSFLDKIRTYAYYACSSSCSYIDKAGVAGACDYSSNVATSRIIRTSTFA